MHLDDKRPHVFIQGAEDTSYVVAVIVIQDLIKKRVPISDMDNWENVMRSILAEWLEFKCNER